MVASFSIYLWSCYFYYLLLWLGRLHPLLSHLFYQRGTSLGISSRRDKTPRTFQTRPTSRCENRRCRRRRCCHPYPFLFFFLACTTRTSRRSSRMPAASTECASWPASSGRGRSTTAASPSPTSSSTPPLAVTIPSGEELLCAPSISQWIPMSMYFYNTLLLFQVHFKIMLLPILVRDRCC